MNAAPLSEKDEFSGLSTGFCASTSEEPLNVCDSAFAMPASPSKAIMPTRVLTVPVAGVKKGAMLVDHGTPFSTLPRPSYTFTRLMPCVASSYATTSAQPAKRSSPRPVWTSATV